jgi:hypothetical protein
MKILKHILILIVVVFTGCKEKTIHSNENKILIPKTSIKILSIKSGLSQLSKKLDIPLEEINESSSSQLKQIYKDYDIDFIIKSWFKTSFLLDFEAGSYVAKIQTYNDDGYPDNINYDICFGDIADIDGDEFIIKYSKNGFFQIAEDQTGDALVIDLKSKNKDIGYLGHEYVWMEKNQNVRKYFQKFASFKEFIENIINDKTIPIGYDYTIKQ